MRTAGLPSPTATLEDRFNRRFSYCLINNNTFYISFQITNSYLSFASTGRPQQQQQNNKASIKMHKGIKSPAKRPALLPSRQTKNGWEGCGYQLWKPKVVWCLDILFGQAPVAGWQAWFPQSHVEEQLMPYRFGGHVLLQLQQRLNSEGDLSYSWKLKTNFKYHSTLTSHPGSQKDKCSFLSHDHSDREGRSYTGNDSHLRMYHLCRVCHICREGEVQSKVI